MSIYAKKSGTITEIAPRIKQNGAIVTPSSAWTKKDGVLKKVWDRYPLIKPTKPTRMKITFVEERDAATARAPLPDLGSPDSVFKIELSPFTADNALYGLKITRPRYVDGVGYETKGQYSAVDETGSFMFSFTADEPSDIYIVEAGATPQLKYDFSDMQFQIRNWRHQEDGDWSFDSAEGMFFTPGTVIYDNAIDDPKITSLSLNVTPTTGSGETTSRGDGYVSISPCSAGIITPVITAEEGFDMSKLSGKLKYQVVDTTVTGNMGGSVRTQDGYCCMDNTGKGTFQVHEPITGSNGYWRITCSTTDGSNLSFSIDGQTDPKKPD